MTACIFSYYTGILSGIFMLLLYLYPLRKHLKFFRSFGKMSKWFLVHTIIGLPILLLIHTKFLLIASLNGAIAFYGIMLIASSGILGRFLLQRVTRGEIWHRLFSHWHIIHIPLVYLVFLAVLIHILAILMY